MFDDSEGFQNILNLIKMKVIFSSGNYVSSFMDIFLSLFFIGFITYVSKIFSSDDTINIFDFNIP